ncbi:MAG: type II secretion system protein [Betaproteobacteria bacterium]|nr:type II secretion system protein [Betaproteobacteria bacterium]
MQNQTGFTLIEIAIVLVIIGLLLGAVLKGQELIQSARVRNLAATQNEVTVAFFGFRDRYRAYPGDYSQASTNLAATTDGNGDGQILLNGAMLESIAAWEHLSKAGFLTGSYTYNATVSSATNPTNAYGVFLQLIFDNAFADTGAAVARHNIKLGNQIPVGIIAELDRKIDDGNAQSGSFRFSAYTEGGAAPTAANCHTAGAWLAATSEPNCGGASLL